MFNLFFLNRIDKKYRSATEPLVLQSLRFILAERTLSFQCLMRSARNNSGVLEISQSQNKLYEQTEGLFPVTFGQNIWFLDI